MKGKVSYLCNFKSIVKVSLTGLASRKVCGKVDSSRESLGLCIPKELSVNAEKCLF